VGKVGYHPSVELEKNTEYRLNERQQREWVFIDIPFQKAVESHID